MTVLCFCVRVRPVREVGCLCFSKLTLRWGGSPTRLAARKSVRIALTRCNFARFASYTLVALLKAIKLPETLRLLAASESSSVKTRC